MKFVRPLLAAAACAMFGCAAEDKPEVTPVSPRKSDTLDPDDIGIGRYVFEAKVPAGKVMVLRRTAERNGRKGGAVLETIEHTNGGQARQVVLVYDRSAFPFADGARDEVRVRGQGGEAIYSDRRCTGKSIRPGRLELEITGDGRKDTVRLTYDCFVEDYATTKKRVPELPVASPGETWSYNMTFGGK
ncbi:hypothetical protein R5W23_005360 [Gemmata sp. JC673]|uniref:Lipoprotein n=1 Tax=Gemmata algarum TaxID=2975278 RepID=A0ABU5FD76_9BACT|nr:hypothetical protein [Gemmata algarum]MDY3563744.1 hypothetical protein [Gemmata algarum]